MGDGADMAREAQWDTFCIYDIFITYPKVRNPWDLPMEFMKEGVLCMLEDIAFQINYNAKNDTWYQKSGNKVKISEMDDNYKNTIVKFLAKKKIKAPKQFCWNGDNMHEMELGNMIFGNSRGEFPIDRGVFQELFVQYIVDMGFDGYGVHDVHGYNGFENQTFVIRPYYWGDDDNLRWLPNFIHKPTGLEIQWYKYPLRDSYSNIELTKDILIKIMDGCVASFYSDKINVLSEGE